MSGSHQIYSDTPLYLVADSMANPAYPDFNKFVRVKVSNNLHRRSMIVALEYLNKFSNTICSFYQDSDYQMLIRS